MVATQQDSGVADATMDIDYFDPDATILTAIRRALVHGQDLLIQAQGEESLLLLGSRGEYFSALEDEARFFTTPLSQLALTLLESGDGRIPPPSRGGRDAGELLWKAAWHASGGALMQGCQPLDRVELLGWPNLTRLPHDEDASRIAALLSHHPASIAFVSRLLHIPLSHVYRFYSAACCAGLVRVVSRKLDEPQLQPHRSRGVLALLWQKLAHARREAVG